MKPNFRIVEQKSNYYQKYYKYIQEYYFSDESVEKIRRKLDISNHIAVKYNKQLLEDYGVIRDQFTGKLVKKVDNIPVFEKGGYEQDYFNHPELKVLEIKEKYNFGEDEWRKLCNNLKKKYGMHRISFQSFARDLSTEEIRTFKDFVREDLKKNID